MNFCKRIYNANYYARIKDVPEKIWNQLGCTNNLYFNPKYFSAIAAYQPNIDFWYIVLSDKTQKPIAFVAIQIVDFYLDSVQNELQGFVNSIKRIQQKLGLISSQKPFKILICGNTFVSGEHGIFIKNTQNKREVIKELTKSVAQLVNSEEYFTYKISAFMMKDFIHKSLFITKELLKYNYHSFNVEPNMLLEIDEEWTSFDDYLAGMKTRFRVKAKRAMELSFSLEIIEIDETNLEIYLPAMEKLYKNVASKAGFNLGMFNLKSYKALKNNLEDKYLIKGYFLKTKLVGFSSAMINQSQLDAHFVGIDYEYNREYAVYQRMLYDYITIAIKKRLKQINFGRTASEIKSSVGAEPQNLTIYLKHKKHFPNRILSFFINRIQPTPFQQKRPFKAKNLIARN